MNKKYIVSALLALIFCHTSVLFAGGGVPDPGIEMAVMMTGIFTVVTIALLFYVLIILDGDLEHITALLKRAYNYIAPPAEETENALDLGHDFDGIRELDNRIPPWFNYLFLGTVLFGIIYMLNFHLFETSKLMAAEYLDEMTTAELQKKIALATEGTIDENNLTVLKSAAALKNGGETFSKFCISCHGPQGGGIVGPNLTDDYWIHGGGIKIVYATIKTGVPAKGMISWQLVFSQKQIQELASYVLSLHGTNPPGGKAPEGTMYVEKDSTTTVAQKIDSVKTKM